MKKLTDNYKRKDKINWSEIDRLNKARCLAEQRLAQKDNEI